eukprot:scaffold122816_cov35-Tisochrysis_lutea.AAC.3
MPSGGNGQSKKKRIATVLHRDMLSPEVWSLVTGLLYGAFCASLQDDEQRIKVCKTMNTELQRKSIHGIVHHAESREIGATRRSIPDPKMQMKAGLHGAEHAWRRK